MKWLLQVYCNYILSNVIRFVTHIIQPKYNPKQGEIKGEVDTVSLYPRDWLKKTKIKIYLDWRRGNVYKHSFEETCNAAQDIKKQVIFVIPFLCFD